MATSAPNARLTSDTSGFRTAASAHPATTRAVVFPGQGSQAVGMGQDLAATYPAARAVFDEVDDALGERLSRLMAEGPEQTLTLTENAQPALMSVSMAVLRVLEAEYGFGIPEIGRYVAGHSLGEYTAPVAGPCRPPCRSARVPWPP